VSIREEWGDRFGRSDPKIVCVGLNYGAGPGLRGGTKGKPGRESRLLHVAEVALVEL